MDVFYEKGINDGVRYLDDQESRHCLKVLRHQVGDRIIVVDGLGGEHHANITSDKKLCQFEIQNTYRMHPKDFSVHLAIAPTKNVDRMEWMIEKLGEIGVEEVTFLMTKNGERSRLRRDRLEKKAISAMKQSGNRFLTKINDLTDFEAFVTNNDSQEKFMAHLGPKTEYLGTAATTEKTVTLLIGPEGDFDPPEVLLAEKAGFQSVSLGQTTLRTETAGLLACHFINVVNQY